MSTHSGLSETWVYLRMSTEEQEDSPLTQGQHTGDFLQQNSLPSWTRTYFDLGKSGGSLEKRPSMMTMLAEAERLRPAYIVFYRLDRAFRNAEEQAVALNRLKRLGVQVMKVRDPNLKGPLGDLIDGILGNINQFERQLTGMRIRDHNLAMAQRGEWPGGAPPFGYTYRKPQREQRGRKKVTVSPGGLEPDEKEWPIARQIWEWALAGYRKAEIADLAAQAGYRKRNGRPWSLDAISLLLLSKTYAGYVPFGRTERTQGKQRRQSDQAMWFPGQHKPMVTMEEWLKVQTTTNSRMGQRRPHSRPRNELSGLVRCLICGGPVVGLAWTKDGGYHYYCQNAIKRAAEHPIWSRREWVIHFALRQVLDAVIDRLPTTPPATLSGPRREALQDEIQRLRNQAKRQRMLFELGEYEDDIDEYKRRRRELEVQIAAKEAELASAGSSPDEILKRWEELRRWQLAYEAAASTREKQRLWGAVVEEVRTDAVKLYVRTRDFGPGVDREWEVDLPPARTRRPGTRCGRGVTGERRVGRTRSSLLSVAMEPRPV